MSTNFFGDGVDGFCKVKLVSTPKKMVERRKKRRKIKVY